MSTEKGTISHGGFAGTQEFVPLICKTCLQSRGEGPLQGRMIVKYGEVLF